jgi:phosphoribosylaminoimidazolecarboxamide formyltransferase/IMP cyclohydrolase
LQTIGIGAGQTSRIGSIELAIKLAQAHQHKLQNSVLASDGFFPFTDSIEVAHQYGIKAIIQPGGSKQDAKIIAKANELNIIMIFTHKRKFCH